MRTPRHSGGEGKTKQSGPSRGAEFNVVAESQLDAERERSNMETSGYRQSLSLALLPEFTCANHPDSSQRDVKNTNR